MPYLRRRNVLLNGGLAVLVTVALPSLSIAQGAPSPTGPTSATPSDPTVGAASAPTSMSGPGATLPGSPTKADGTVPGTKVPEQGSAGAISHGNAGN